MDRDHKGRENLYHGRGPGGGRENGFPLEELHFHSREEAPSPDDYSRKKNRKRGIFKNNPSLLIILVDIVVVVLVMLFLIPFLRHDSRVDDFHGYDFSLHGYLHNGMAYASVTAQPEYSPSELSKSPGGEELPGFIVTLKIRDTELEEELELKKTGEPNILRAQFQLPGTMDDKDIYIWAEVAHKGDSVTLQRKLSR